MASNAERQLNLMILLLVSSRLLTKAEIREAIEAYHGKNDAAFERMFDRDKEALRERGIPLETGVIDHYFDDESGYRISRDEFELPAVEFDREELAVIGLAARAWANESLAATANAALLKFKAAGIHIDRSQLDELQPVVRTDESAFLPLWSATDSRTAVQFDYQRPGHARTSRKLQPWRMFSISGRWYVVGHDLAREEPRAFKLSRIVGEVTTTGKAGSYEAPDEQVIREAAARLVPAPDTTVGTATLLVLQGAGNGLRRYARQIDTAVAETASGVWDRVTIDLRSLDGVTADVLALGDRVVAEQPEELVQAVTTALTRLAGERQ